MANYTYPGTFTVKNKLNIADHEEFERIETGLVEGRRAEIEAGYGPKGGFDPEHLKALHRYLFQDVYEWAGHTRDERVNLSDGTTATEPVMRREGSKEFLTGRFIPGALGDLTERFRDADYLRSLSREDFATRAADLMAELNAIHPFREGNGRTQRVFMEELARQAGHDLDFTVVTKERMIQASIAANDLDDPTVMRRLFDEISNPARVAALREKIDYFEEHNSKSKAAKPFKWNDYYLATTEPGHEVRLIMASAGGEHFMARTQSQILIGRTADLPAPHPESGVSFDFVASESAWQNETDRRVREESQSNPQHAASNTESRREREARELEERTSGERTDAKQRRSDRASERSNREGEDLRGTDHYRSPDHNQDGGRSR